MTPQPYQNAYDTAIAELHQIVAKFEQLRARKDQIEGLVQALQPFFADSSEPQPVESGNRAADLTGAPRHESSQLAAHDAEPPEGYSFRDVPNPLPEIEETGGDPFQRRGKPTFRFRGLAAQR